MVLKIDEIPYSDELRKQYGLAKGETLQDKWRRESAERLAELRAMSLDELLDEVRDTCGDEDLIVVLFERMR